MQHPDPASPPETTSRCLHLVAGAGRDALDDCLAQLAPGDSVVFLDAGVLHLLRSSAALPGAASEVFYTDADLRAHGLLEAARRARAGVVDDAGVCALLAQYEHCLTWR